jgi:hypothetical protein
MPEKPIPEARRARAAGMKRPQVVPREYAGKWLAWSPDGLRIVAVADSFEDCERAAAAAGFTAVAIDRVPLGRVIDGPWTRS